MLTFLKFTEMFFVIAITITAVYKLNMIIFISENLPQSEPLLSGVQLALLLTDIIVMVFHTMHQNLLVNLRLALSRKGSCWWFCWKPINYLICKYGRADQKWHGLQYICRDRCVTIVTVIKYCLILPLFIVPATQLFNLSYDCDQQSLLQNDGEQALALIDLADHYYDLGLVFLLFAIQHFIFIIARIIFFLLITILCCGCSCADQELVGLQPITQEE